MPDFGAEKVPGEYDSHAWSLFFTGLGNSRSGTSLLTVDGQEGFIELVDERRKHVVVVKEDLTELFFVKMWNVAKFGARNAPPLPRCIF